MNTQEAIKKIKQLPLINYSSTEFVEEIIDIVNQIDQPQKVVVPAFIDSYIRYAKVEGMSLFIAMDNAQNKESEWIINNQETFARAWLFGYEVEQEKLYTVEIPNPHATHDDVYILGRTLSGSIAIWRSVGRNGNKNYDSDFQLTESEIKQDFEWAWQFAKEVEEDK
ncbi:DUF1642 domain-containing protein [Streptococcus porci]|uniref:DUF1642 domain-containing protein n=1 Tax=Streptococcus porci TaxID=502567 RepID=UPI0003FF941B|nr:DUF1642 domain-containing protein [Streptococcus porci]